MAEKNQGNGRSWRNKYIPLFLFLMTCNSVALAVQPMIAVEESHSMALKSDGTVWAWGDNTMGQLGDGTITNHVSPVQVANLTGIVQIAAGGAFLGGVTAANHSVALHADGTVWTWGSGRSGQLGEGDIPANTCLCKTAPIHVAGLSGITAVAAGSQHTVALKSDGTVWAWGDNSKGQIGDGTHSNRLSPIRIIGLTNVVAIAAGYQHTVALKSDGSVWTWGNNSTGALGDGTQSDRNTPVQVAGLGGVSGISAGAMHTVALKSDGTAWAWGLNSFRLVYNMLPTIGGQIGDGTMTDRLTPVQVSSLGNSVLAIAAGSYHTVFLKTDGSVWATGNNMTGQLGDGTTSNRLLPVQAKGVSNAQGIAAASYHTMVFKQDGNVWAWGNNGYGELGNGEFGSIYVPVTVPGQVVGTNSTGFLNLLANTNQFSSSATASFSLKPSKASGGYAVTADASASSDIRNDITQYLWSSSDGQTASGRIVTFNYFRDGTYTINLQVVDSAGETSSASTSISLPIQQASTAMACNRSCLVLTTEGIVQGWGDNRMGQLGIDTSSYSSIPRRTALLANVRSISAGFFHTLAAKSDGSIWAWGNNTLGQAGSTASARFFHPVPIAGLSHVTAVAAGYEFSLALLSDGTVWGLGWNYFGQLGDGTTSNAITGRAVPAPVHNLNGVTAIAAGGWINEAHGIALKNDGSVWTWGSNNSGQLGDASNINRPEPVQVVGLSNVTAIAAGQNYTLALKSDGTVWAWGNNAFGQLGSGSTASSTQPVQVHLSNRIVKISAGIQHSAAIAADGTLWLWGDNSQGQLGNDAGAQAMIPVSIKLASPVKDIATGVNQTVAEMVDGTVLAWGGNEYGQLGDGTFAVRPTPALVISETADGPLDLIPELPNNIAPDLLPPFFVIASGGISAATASVSTLTKFNTPDVGKPGSVFVTAMVPAGTIAVAGQKILSAPNSLPARMKPAGATSSTFELVQLTASGWQQIVNGQLVPYASGVLGDQLAAQTILSNTDTTKLQGAAFCVGYGTSAANMIAVGTIRTVATIGVPASSCVLTINQPTNDCIFNWLEDKFPGYFSTGRPTSQSLSPYYYRHYAATHSYVGVSSADGHLYYLSPATGLADEGLASYWAAQAACK